MCGLGRIRSLIHVVEKRSFNWPMIASPALLYKRANFQE